ncbi:MAG: methylmalonyl Co-A mutase-associated GTPase MeaB [Acidimicrobiales bacterium]
MNVVGLLEQAANGEKVAVARLISLVERGGDAAREVVRHSRNNRDLYAVGITGAPGAGKSSLTDRLVSEARSSGAAQVGVIAVDPSSLFSGGAILGDRVRMQRHALDDGVFIRSMATRGHLGGLALAVPDALGVLAIAGVSIAFVETVGVGQVEVEVASDTDTTVVVVNPGWGDSIQANKAGLLEVADVFVINKADRPGASGTERDLDLALDMSAAFRHGRAASANDGLQDEPWRPPIVKTVALTGDGIADLWRAIGEHRRYLESRELLDANRRERLGKRVREIVASRIEQQVNQVIDAGALDSVMPLLAQARIDPYEAADRIMEIARDASQAGASASGIPREHEGTSSRGSQR